MKKLFGLMAIAIVAFAFTACGSSKNESPEAVAKAYLQCFQKGNFDGLKGVVYFENEAELDKTIQVLQEKAKSDDFKKYMKIEKFEIGEVVMAENGESAKVNYVATNAAGKESKEKVKTILKDGKWYVKM